MGAPQEREALGTPGYFYIYYFYGFLGIPIRGYVKITLCNAQI